MYNRNIAQVTNRFFNFILNFVHYWTQESLNTCAWEHTTWRYHYMWASSIEHRELAIRY